MEILSRSLRKMCTIPNVSFHPKCAKLGLTHLVFADDLMIFTRGDLPSVKMATNILQKFSVWSGLRANLDKTNIYFGGVTDDVRSLILSKTGLQEGNFPFRYLGLPLHASRLTADMYGSLIIKLQKIISNCSSRHLSYAGRIQILNSMVFGLGNFWCSSLLLPRNVSTVITRICRQFFWNYTSEHRKLVNKSWDSICAPWEEGGFNTKNIEVWNRACLLKWLWRLDKKVGSIWVHWMSKYYLNDVTIWQLNIREHHPQCLRGVIQVRNAIAAQLGSDNAVKKLLHDCTNADSFSVRKAYEAIRTRFPVAQCSTAIQKGMFLPRHKIFLAMATQQCLVTQDQLAKKGIHFTNRCCLCKASEESHDHLFFQCSFSKEILAAVKNWVGINTNDTTLVELLNWTTEKKVRRHWRIQWVRCSIAAAAYIIWGERNARIFPDLRRTSQSIIKQIKYTVSTIILIKVPGKLHEEIVDSLNSKG